MDFKLEVVPVPVANVERALRLYREEAGFVLDHDTGVGDGMRWNSFAFFSDPDGNSWVLQERPG